MRVATMSEAEALRVAAPKDDAGLGALRTERGNLPLDRIDVRTAITGLVARIDLTQEFVNVHDEPLEATYVFPLPDRAAVTRMAMTADGRVVEAELQERGAARETYDRAVAAGRRASIAEEERPDVFSMRVGNILPGERVSVALSLAGPLSFEDGEATFRFPLVVAPRYIPGSALDGDSVGVGHALDTDAVPDASRITPPVLLPGFPNPLRLSIEVDIDPAGLPLGDVRSSLHTVQRTGQTVSVLPGERADRDFVLRLAYGPGEAGLALVPDATGDEGTYRLTVLPPSTQAPPKPKDVVLLLDRSGSMGGWKMVAARRAAARIVDTLTVADRFAVLAFDDRVETPASLPSGLADGTDRHRFRAVEHLARVDARGGTELLQPLIDGLKLLEPAAGAGAVAGAGDRDRVIVLVTDGQVGNEDQILRTVATALRGVRVHTVGIDQAVNAGFLGRLAIAGGGRCELVESEDRLDEAMDRIHRRIGAPVASGVSVTAEGLDLLDDTQAPARLPDVFPGVPFVVTGRYRGAGEGTLTVAGTMRDGSPWSTTVTATRHDNPALTAIWARALLRDLEDAYVSGTGGGDELERRITGISLRFQVLCRFTAYVAVDKRVVTEGGEPRQVVQPVDLPAGWEPPVAVPRPPLHPTSMPYAAPAASPMYSRTAAMPAPGGPPPMMPPMPSAPPPAPPMMPPPGPMSGAPVTGAPQPQRRSVGSVFGRPGGGGSARTLRGKAARPQVPVEQPSVEAERQRAGSEELRELAASEARRLREAEDRPDFERRELLEDLGSRLAVLGIGVLRALAERLTPAAIAARPLAELWREVLAELDAVAGGGQPPATRGTFWKR